MTSLQRQVELENPDIEWTHLKTLTHRYRNTDYELLVCRVVQSGQYRIYVASNGYIHAYIFDHKHDRLSDPCSPAGNAIVNDLLTGAIIDIEENDRDLYTPV